MDAKTDTAPVWLSGPGGMLVRYTARSHRYGALERPQIVDNSHISGERIVAVACRHIAKK